MKTTILRISIIIAVLAIGFVITAVSKETPMSTSKYVGGGDAPDFPREADWLNTKRPWSMNDFRGKIVMLDFWTYCCINCIHIIPDLKRLEAKYPDELVVVGVHSAKFTTEKETDNIRQAVVRYGIEHPVINDSEFKLWRQYGIRAWPSIALIDPNGKVVGVSSGEGVFDTYDSIIGEMVKHFDREGTLSRAKLDLETELSKAPASLLAYPGKLTADVDRLYISDSNHNRIVVSTLKSREVVKIIGSGATGFADGTADEAMFNQPQGMAIVGDVLYVADTENHAVRAVDLTTWTVSTLAGTGRQSRSFNTPGTGTAVALNSPWDLLYHDGSLYVAMAGSHQVWSIDPKTGYAAPYAGSGRENRTDGSLNSSALAQPSGLASDGVTLYVADSEVSAIRAIDLPKGGGERVRTLAGGELFEFGLKDRSGLDARFQHPLGVAYHGGKVYVADTYNNSIRVIDAKTGGVKTLHGDGKPGVRDGKNARFDEPNDVIVVGDSLYIADTNNHRIRVAPLTGGSVTTLAFTNPDMLRMTTASIMPEPGEKVVLPAQSVKPGTSELVIEVDLPDGYKLTAAAPSALTIRETPLVAKTEPYRVTSLPIRVPVTFVAGTGTLSIDLSLYYCEEKTASLCYFADARIEVPLVVEAGGKETVEVKYGVGR